MQVGEQLTGQLASVFAVDQDPMTNTALLLVSMFSALVFGGGMIVIELSATAAAKAHDAHARPVAHAQ